MNPDFTDFISINCNLSDGLVHFLVDSQADISVIKISALTNNFYYDISEKILIKGVTNSTISSMGTVMIDLIVDNVTIEHKFHLVDDDMAIPTDGIIGKDFIKLNRCCLDYDSMSLTIRLPQFDLNVPIRSELGDNMINIPARSEVFRLFRLSDTNYPRFIESQQIADGVIVPNTIAYSNEVWIRVLNTSQENQVINTSETLRTRSIQNFDIYLPQGNTPNREIDLMNLLKIKIPKHAPKRLEELCMKFSHIFAMPGDQATVNNFYEQKLNLRDNEPVYVKNYRLPQTQKEEINSQVQALLDKDLIELSKSNYNSPLILVPKKSIDGERKWRMCVDYRLLNRKLIPDKFSLPRIEEILDGLGRARYFSVMDLQSGFHQIPLEEKSRPATAFSTDRGFYQWKVLPFGLSIAPSSFSRMMTLAFAGLKPEQAFIYMDDIIVIGFSERHHLKNLQAVFEICEKYNLRLNPDKCDFFRHEVSFLGHKCTSEGLLPDPAKLNAVKNSPRPNDKSEVKRFVAFANYYRRFVANFSEIVRPLTKLTGKRVPFCWTEEQGRSFNLLKDKLITPPILSYPDFSREFTVTVDASQFACGGVLSQDFNGQDLPITYISRTFKKGEINKPTIEKELLAIHYAITTLRPYLYGRPFRVKSDHKPLIFLYNLKNPASKLTRVRLELEEYDFVVEYIPGKLNVAADALSRISIQDLKRMGDCMEKSVLATTRSMTRRANERVIEMNETHGTDSVQRTNLIEQLGSCFDKNIPRIRTTIFTQNDEPASIEICIFLKHRKVYEIKIDSSANEKLNLNSILSQLQRAADKMKLNMIQWPLNDTMFQMCNYEEFKEACNSLLGNLQIITFKPPEVISDHDRKQKILEQFHYDKLYGGHYGQKKLYAKIRSNYYWKGMTRDISEFVRNCTKCQLNKPKRKNFETMSLTPTPQRPFDVVIIDTVGPLPITYYNYRYALTMICDLSKYLIAVPLKTKSAEEVAKAIFENFILKFGPMKEIRSDMGTEYRNELISELCKLMNIEQITSTAYHHQTVGAVERNHRVFNEYIRSYLSNENDKWDTYLHYFTFCYNITQHSSNNDSYSPYELVFGRKINLPIEFLNGKVDPIYNVENYVKTMKYLLQDAHLKTAKLIDKMKIRNKEYFDRKAKPLNVDIGDMVYIEIEPYNKLRQKYNGPYKIVKIEEPNVTIQTGTNTTTVHEDRVRLATKL